MLIEPVTYVTQNGCFEVQEKWKFGLHSTEVTDGSIRFNPRLYSDPLCMVIQNTPETRNLIFRESTAAL